MSAIDAVRQQLGAAPLRWCVTGSAGFIGSHLVEALLRLDQTVVSLDNFATGHRRNLDEVRDALPAAQWRRHRFEEADIRDPAACRAVCREVDVVLHQAALGSVPRSLADPLATNASNVDGFLNMLVAARDAGARRFVYAASSSTYGDEPNLPKIEERIGRPLSPYAVTKLVNELYAEVFGRCYGVSAVGLRYFNVFGPRQDPEGAYAAVIPRWIGEMLRGEDVLINGDGETSRDFCYVDNAVQANLLAAVAPLSETTSVFNVALDERTTLNDLFAQLKRELAQHVPAVAARAGAARRLQAGRRAPFAGGYRQGEAASGLRTDAPAGRWLARGHAVVRRAPRRARARPRDVGKLTCAGLPGAGSCRRSRSCLRWRARRRLPTAAPECPPRWLRTSPPRVLQPPRATPHRCAPKPCATSTAKASPKDPARAYELYCAAAKEGDAEAQYALGWMHANGRGVARSDELASLFFTMAAEQGLAQARAMLPLVGPPTGDMPPCMRDFAIVAEREKPAVEAPTAEEPMPSASVDDVGSFVPANPAQEKLATLVRAIAPQYNVSPLLALAFIRAESNFDPLARSPRNAQGLMQLIPETSARFAVKRPFDPVQNLRGGLAYLRWLLAYFRGNVPLVAAAYNAGEKTVERYRGVPPYPETRLYVKRIMEVFHKAWHPFDPTVADPSPELDRIRTIGAP